MEFEPVTWKEAEEIDVKSKQHNVEYTSHSSSKQLLEFEETEDPLGLTSKVSHHFLGTMGRHRSRTLRPRRRTAMRRKAPGINFSGRTSIAGRGTVCLNDERFNPTLFLGTVHQGTSYDELENGLVHLRQKMQSQTERLQALVKDNLSLFLRCKFTVDEVKTSELDSFNIDYLTNRYEEMQQTGDKLLTPIIDRKKSTDKIRNVLNLLNRFQFLFRLPARLERNIGSGDYDRVVHDYRKAKAFTSVSHINIFSKVFDRVERIVGDLRSNLFERLRLVEDAEEQHRMINYLFELDAKDDPSWIYARDQIKYVTDLLQICDTGFEQRLTDVRKIKLSAEALRIHGSTQVADVVTNARLIRRMNTIVEKHVENLWDLIGLVMSRKYAKPNMEESELASRESDMLSMFEDLLKTYAGKLSQAFDAVDNRRETIQPLLRDSLSEAMKVFAKLEELSLADSVLAFPRDVRRRLLSSYVDGMCERQVKEISALYQHESWLLEGENSTVTRLPGMFKAKLFTTIEEIRKVLQCRLENREIKEVERSAYDFLKSAFLAFADCLHELAFFDGNDTNVVFSPSRSSGPMKTVEKRLSTDSMGQSLSNETVFSFKNGDSDYGYQDVRWLMIASNATFTSSILPMIMKEFADTFQQATPTELLSNVQDIQSVYDILHEMVVSAYVSRKSVYFASHLRGGIFCGGVYWPVAPEPTEIRSYVMELLLELVFVYDDVRKLTKQSPERTICIFGRILEAILESFSDFIRDVDGFNANGAAQVGMEVEFLYRALSSFRTVNCERIMEKISNYLSSAAKRYVEHDVGVSSWQGEEKYRRKEELLRDTEYKTRLQLKCFNL